MVSNRIVAKNVGERNLLGDNLGLSIAKNHGTGRGESSESIHALLSAILLPETNGDVEDDNKDKHTTFDVVFDTETQSHGECKNLWRVSLANWVWKGVPLTIHL